MVPRDESQKFEPKEVKGTKLGLVVHQLRREILRHNADCHIVTELKSHLVSTKELRLPNGPIKFSFTPPGSNREERFEIQCSGPSHIRLGDLLNFVQTMEDSTDPNLEDFPKFPEVIDALNIILGYSARSNGHVAVVGRSRFFPFEAQAGSDNSMQLDGAKRGLIAIRGFSQSVRIGPTRLLVNVNTTCAAFRLQGPVVDFTVKPYHIRGNDFEKRNLSKLLNRARVEFKLPTDSEGRYTRTMTLQGLATAENRHFKKTGHPPRFTGQSLFPPPHEVEFYLKDPGPELGGSSRYISVEEYYKKRK